MRTGWRSSWRGLRGAPGDGRDEKNTAPSQWGRRLARLVGAKYGVQMCANRSINEGCHRGRNIAIKCAKSPTPPVSVLIAMLERVDAVWAVYVLPQGGAVIYSLDQRSVRQVGYFTRGANVQKRVEIYMRKIQPISTVVGRLTAEEVESCRIP